MEINGQGSEIVPAAQNESEEQSTLHTGHSARYVSTTASDLLQERGPDACATQQRALQCVHQQSDAKVQAGH